MPKAHCGRGYLTNSYALPEFRGQGVGTALLSTITEWPAQRRWNFWWSGPAGKAIPSMNARALPSMTIRWC
ncbi:GNAT family N-acetyltransferase [bacterium AH-315-P15]|nr:GNAT family N-acetyltransferase [bacterium AH-315-P15]